MDEIPSGAKVKMKTGAPTRKVYLGALGGVVATILVFILNTYVLSTNRLLTPEISAAIATVVYFVVAFLVHPNANDQIEVDQGA